MAADLPSIKRIRLDTSISLSDTPSSSLSSGSGGENKVTTPSNAFARKALPDDLIVQIISFLSTKQQLAATRVNRQWHQFVTSDALLLNHIDLGDLINSNDDGITTVLRVRRILERASPSRIRKVVTNSEFLSSIPAIFDSPWPLNLFCERLTVNGHVTASLISNFPKFKPQLIEFTICDCCSHETLRAASIKLQYPFASFGQSHCQGCDTIASQPSYYRQCVACKSSFCMKCVQQSWPCRYQCRCYHCKQQPLSSAVASCSLHCVTCSNSTPPASTPASSTSSASNATPTRPSLARNRSTGATAAAATQTQSILPIPGVVGVEPAPRRRAPTNAPDAAEAGTLAGAEPPGGGNNDDDDDNTTPTVIHVAMQTTNGQRVIRRFVVPSSVIYIPMPSIALHFLPKAVTT